MVGRLGGGDNPVDSETPDVDQPFAAVQLQLDQLSENSKGQPVGAIVPKFQAILGHHGIEVSRITVLAAATAMSNGGTFTFH
jgi:hypothetical protein